MMEKARTSGIRPGARLGSILVDRGAVTYAKLRDALLEQKAVRKRLGHILLENGTVKESQLLAALAAQRGIAPPAAKDLTPDPGVARSLPGTLSPDFCRRKLFYPLSVSGSEIRVAMADPDDRDTLDEIWRESGCEVVPVLCPEYRVIRTLEKAFGTSLKDGFRRDPPPVPPPYQDPEQTGLWAKTAERILDSLVLHAVAERTEDVHLELTGRKARVRYRVDGVLREEPAPPLERYAQVISVIKVRAGIDVADKRPRIADGGFRVNGPGGVVDVRASIVPTLDGECATLRIQSQTNLMPLEDLGMDERTRRLFRAALSRPTGLVLVSGPPGSGKTTTLYSGLALLDTTRLKIISVEDPVEYRTPGMVQVPVRGETTFQVGLKGVLRQDPDVVMLGEVRDPETCEILVRSSLTGQLLLCSVHARTAAGIVPRLMDLGVSPRMIGETVTLLVSQRLVRRNCPHCSQPVSIPEHLSGRFRDPPLLLRGRGCQTCRGSGYLGRVGVFEAIPVTDRIRELLLYDVTTSSIKEAAAGDGFVSLQQAGYRLVEDGATTPEEVERVLVG